MMGWWELVRSVQGHVERLVIYPDDGPKNSGRRTQFLKRMVQFADWSGLEVRLVPYHSKYDPVERCWSAPERKWRGVLLDSLGVILWCARRMTSKGRHPTVRILLGKYRDGCASRPRRRGWSRRGCSGRRPCRSTTSPSYEVTEGEVGRPSVSVEVGPRRIAGHDIDDGLLVLPATCVDYLDAVPGRPTSRPGFGP